MTSFIDHKIKDGINDHSRVLATRQDLVEGLAAGKQDLAEGFARVRVEFGEKFGQIDVKIASSKSEIIKWMFIFWITQLMVILGFLQVFLKK